MDSHNDENQMLLDELLNQHNNKSTGNNNSMTNFLDFYDDIQHSSSVTQNRNAQQQQQMTNDNGPGQNRFVYPGSNPAMQHEKLAYMNQNQNTNNNVRNSFQGNNHNSLDNEMVNASFLDDMFTTSSSQALQKQQQQQQQEDPQQQQQYQQDQQEMSRDDSISVANSYTQSFTDEQIPHDLFRNNLEDQMINFTDDMSSSLGSSIHSDFMNSNFGTPTSSLLNSHNLETINSLTATSYNQNNTFSPGSLRSPSSSFRPSVSYLSTSLRQPSTLSNYNPNTTANNININVGTPNSRNPSISAQGIESALSTSVPKSLSHLSQDEKLRRKRDFHNAVERRRRDLIKQKINELGNLVPPSMLRFDDKGKPVKPNKGIILNKTVDYVRFLLEVDRAQDHKRQQLLNKINELQDKFNNMDLKGMNDDMTGSVSTSATITNMTIPHQIQHIAEGEERIIDSRAYPNPKAEMKNETHDDLHQFLSGDILEAQDNAQMMFGDPSHDHNSGNSNAADYLLEFES